MLPEDEERDLLDAATGGDELALERLLLAYYDRLAARIERRLSSALRAVVSEEDILQQTLIDATRAIGSFRPVGRWAFYRWLCAIAEHRLQDEIKAQRALKRGGGRVQVVWQDSARQLIDALSASRRTPSRSVALDEAARAVQAGLAHLGEDQRRALQLRYVRGLSPAQVAHEMGRSPHAVHNLCHRGLNELHIVLGRSSKYVTRR